MIGLWTGVSIDFPKTIGSFAHVINRHFDIIDRHHIIGFRLLSINSIPALGENFCPTYEETNLTGQR